MTDPAARVQIGTTELSLPRLGFGTAPIGGLYEPVPDEQAQAVLRAAWQAGLRYFDTAPWYGYGTAEEHLGQALHGQEGSAISTKVGRLLREDIPPHPTQLEPDGTRGFKVRTARNVTYDYSYDGVMRSHEDSLKRLNVDRVDILLIHDPDAVGVGTRELMGGAYRALHELREQGVIHAFGAGMNQWQMPAELIREGDFDLFLLAGRYTLLEQEPLREFLPLCAARDVKVVIGGVFNSGLLASPHPGARYNYAPAPDAALARAQAIQAVCTRHGVPIQAAALQFPLAHPVVASVLIAGRVPERVEENLAFLRTSVPAALWEELKAEDLLDAAAPVPVSPG
ncbi:aldo/keto reductase [Deinococcus hopiensis]|uniref:D-threo-aldose 1-dehydrogenase n=1 Tax=Deinococcus hopiensis KR-140 TaxID=695939 RepID=A0A1W1UQM3_9DEIO|nr:aldo/keto reductase [Deinococcus hopiensis]SMB83356.1 D-threo-aldose 1-dehydrogenase [Deinococcus hopiensis KR-140]